MSDISGIREQIFGKEILIYEPGNKANRNTANSQVLHDIHPHTTWIIVLGGPREYTAQIVRPSPSRHAPTHIVILQGPPQQLTVEGALRALLDKTAVLLDRKMQTDFTFRDGFEEKY